jgi:ribonuclease HII
MESTLHNDGYKFIAGIDEVGRGPIAGPVYAGAVIFPSGLDLNSKWLSRIDDSKKLTRANRERAAKHIYESATAVSIGSSNSVEVDRLGIVEATRLAMTRAIEGLPVTPDFLIVDHISLPTAKLPFASITKGDSRCYSIAAASIVAKVARDQIMVQYNIEYPDYRFDLNKGYGTPAHLRQLHIHGPCSIHRFSFAPVQLCQLAGKSS